MKRNTLYCSFLEFVERNSNSYNCNDKECDDQEENLMQKNKAALSLNDYKNNNNTETSKAAEKNNNFDFTSVDFDRNEIKEEKHFMKKVISFKDKLTNSLINSNSNSIQVKKYNDFINQQNQKIFYAIDNNYIGVIKSLESNYDEIMKIINIENKTPLLYCIHNNKIEIANLFISKVNFMKIPKAHIYLHKAIRIRDTTLVAKLLDMGISTKDADDQGNQLF